MPVLTWPSTLIPSTFEIALVTPTQIFPSELTGTIQTLELPGTRWQGMMAFSNLVDEKAHTLRGFLASLRGQSGRFYLPAFDKRIPSGTALGSPQVKGVNQTGSTLAIDGCTANQAAFLKAGDYFQVGDELKIMTANAATDSAGETTLNFAPVLRTSPADNAAIITATPKLVAALADQNQVRWSQQPGAFYAMAVSFLEPLDI